jgi:hypothetical protein
LALFNEARKRIGFVLTGCDLENVQIFSLAALYYQSCFRHVDFWRMTVSASMACHVLVTWYIPSPHFDSFLLLMNLPAIPLIGIPLEEI